MCYKLIHCLEIIADAASASSKYLLLLDVKVDVHVWMWMWMSLARTNVCTLIDELLITLSMTSVRA